MHGAATMAALPSADAVLLVSDASQEYTAPELEFLRHAASVCPNVACVLTKSDLYPEWRRIAELDRAHLADGRDRRRSCSPSPPRCAGTPCWATTPRSTWSPGSRRSSGYLRQRVLGQADRLARRGIGARRARRHRPARGEPARRARGPAEPRLRPASSSSELADAQQRAAGAEGAVRALAADPQRRCRRPERRHRPRPARPDARDQPRGRGGAGHRGRPHQGVGPVLGLGAAGGGRRRVGQLRLGHPARTRPGPAGGRPLLRRTRAGASRPAQRPVGRAALGPGDHRARDRAVDRRPEGADRAARAATWGC